MFRIRKHIFETNSSSSDYYNESFYDEPTTARVNQEVHICLKYPDDFTDEDEERVSEKIVAAINDNIDIISPIYSIANSGSNEEIWCEYDEICLYLEATAEIHWEGQYYPATRYEPEEYPEPVIDEVNEVPGSGEDFKGKEELKEKLLKNLRDAGFTEVIKVIDIYGYDLYDSDYYDNI